MFQSHPVCAQQGEDTITRLQTLDTVFITASRYEQNKAEVPSRVSVIRKNSIEVSAHHSADEFLLEIPGIHTDRDFGVFSRNAGVTMRGMNSTARVLVMINGIPINKADGGGINWNRIIPAQIERIEIVKGPASTIYGGNAMAGIINVLTTQPEKRINAHVIASLGSYNTYTLNTNLSGNEIKKDKGFYWKLNNFLRQGDGYMVNPPEAATEFDTTVFLKELGADAVLGYQLNKNVRIEAEYNYWDDVRSDGNKVHEELGSYNSYKTHAARVNYYQKMGIGELKMQPYYQLENYFRQNETVSKKTNKYKFYDTYADREDYGLLTSFTIPLREEMNMVCGIDCKQGKVVTEEKYYTSTDLTQKKGQLNQYALYALWQGKLINNKLNLSAGVRYDRIAFRNGAFIIETPSALTSFIDDYPVVFTDENWGALSPKLSARYPVTKKLSAYMSYAIGYRPPMLDDMCTNRSVTKGFKIANTKLAPEYLYNYELGGDLTITEKIRFETSLYHSIGKGFHYFVGTGDSVDTGGDALKPVLIRDNIAGVKIYGIESALDVILFKNLIWKINHAYNYSYISVFENEKYEDKSLEGKFLMEVPDHTVNTSLQYIYKDFTGNLSFHYVGKQWIDDENTAFVPAYHYINARITSPRIKYFKLGLEVDNILNNRFLNNKGQWCPGRYFQFDLIFNY